MKLAEIRRALDDINAHPMDYAAAQSIWTLEEAWDEYKHRDGLGDYRNVIEDRFILAHSLRKRAGF